jgi:hypothetical protein
LEYFNGQTPYKIAQLAHSTGTRRLYDYQFVCLTFYEQIKSTSSAWYFYIYLPRSVNFIMV